MIVADLFSLIMKMKASGCTILLVEQNVHQALDVCDRFAAIERGSIVLSGNASNPADRERLLETIAF
jgi:branched-chain amino acid transport system ATP-binding protein